MLSFPVSLCSLPTPTVTRLVPLLVLGRLLVGLGLVLRVGVLRRRLVLSGRLPTVHAAAPIRELIAMRLLWTQLFTASLS